MFSCFFLNNYSYPWQVFECTFTFLHEIRTHTHTHTKCSINTFIMYYLRWIFSYIKQEYPSWNILFFQMIFVYPLYYIIITLRVIGYVTSNSGCPFISVQLSKQMACLNDSTHVEQKQLDSTRKKKIKQANKTVHAKNI